MASMECAREYETAERPREEAVVGQRGFISEHGRGGAVSTYKLAHN
jgi:hypothetical protein